MRKLNRKQSDIISYYRQWCKDVVFARKTDTPIKPYQVFLSGPGGVGKGFTIKMIRNDIVKLLQNVNNITPGDMPILITASTGVASLNINGRHPPIVRLAVHEENQHTVVFKEGEKATTLDKNTKTTLTAWMDFNINHQEARQHTYDQSFKEATVAPQDQSTTALRECTPPHQHKVNATTCACYYITFQEQHATKTSKQLMVRHIQANSYNTGSSRQ